MTRAAWAALIVGSLCLFVLSWSLLHHGSLGSGQITDTPTYQSYGDAMARGAVPYRDFALEYPPGALPVFILPSLGHEGDRVAYDRWFDREMALCGCLALLGTALCLRALRAGPTRTAAALGFFGVAPLLIGSVTLTRFDFWPAALLVFALAALLWDRPIPAAILLGCAIGAKLWPAALAPLFVVWLVRTHGARIAGLWTAGVAAVVAAIFLPFTVLAPGGVGHSFHSQLARPLQIESLGSAILIAVHHVAGTTLHVTGSFGSQNVTGPGAHAAEIVTTIAGVLALAGIWALFARGPATGARLAAHSAAAIAAMLAFGKVFSPQFVIWLVPFVLLVGGLRGVAAGAFLAAVLALTHAWFPHHYWALAQGFAPTQSGELLARDLCVAALLVVLAWPGLQHEMLGEHRSRLEALQRVRTQID
jgi:Glycosyltransferase family 87